MGQWTPRQGEKIKIIVIWDLGKNKYLSVKVGKTGKRHEFTCPVPGPGESSILSRSVPHLLPTKM
jgi:hypothetical protein